MRSPRLKVIYKLPAVLFFLPRQALAVAYGEGAYGSCRYGEGCSGANPGFFGKYGWIIFLALILLSAALIIWLLLARRRKRKDKKTQPPQPTSRS